MTDAFAQSLKNRRAWKIQNGSTEALDERHGDREPVIAIPWARSLGTFAFAVAARDPGRF
jgi:hypothetical protein